MRPTLAERVAATLREWKPRDPIPAAVRKALAHPAAVARVHGLILRLSGYHNLTNDQRRERAQLMARAALMDEGLALGSHDISLLVALVYARVKEETPFLIAPAPRTP